MSSLSNETLSFEKDLIKISIAHIILFVLGILFSLIISYTSKDDESTRLIKSAVKVDIVAMPKLTIQELKKIQIGAPPEEVKEKVIKNEKSDIEFLKKEKKVDLKNLLTGLSDKQVEKAKKKKVKENSQNKKLQELLLEGNKLSKGSAVIGDKSDQSSAILDEYLRQLPSYVRPYWKLPSYLMDKNLRCRVRVYISRAGSITRTEIFESSGNEEYDQRALAAIKKVSAFPRPEKEILSDVVSGRIVLGFPL